MDTMKCRRAGTANGVFADETQPVCDLQMCLFPLLNCAVAKLLLYRAGLTCTPWYSVCQSHTLPLHALSTWINTRTQRHSRKLTEIRCYTPLLLTSWPVIVVDARCICIKWNTTPETQIAQFITRVAEALFHDAMGRHVTPRATRTHNFKASLFPVYLQPKLSLLAARWF